MYSSKLNPHPHSPTPTPTLAQQLHRIKTLTCNLLPSPEFWLGYIAAHTSSISHLKKQAFSLDDWRALSQLLKFLGELCQSNAISVSNVFEVIVYGVWDGLGERERGSDGIDLVKLIGTVEKYLNEIVVDPRYFDKRSATETKVQKNSSSFQLQSQSQSQSQTQNKISNRIKQQQIMIPTNVNRVESDGIGLQCPICLASISLSTVCPIACGHNLHRSCFIEHFKTRLDVKKFPISCPEEGCNAQVIIQDLQQYIPKQLLQKYYEFSLHEFVDKNKKSTNWCPTPGCSAIFSIQGHLLTYNCPSCSKTYCLSCKTESHPTLSCQQNKSNQNIPEQDKQFLAFALGEGARMKQCPSCKFWVEKNKGCDHMTCRCTYEFCFRCGARYGDCGCDQADSYYGDDDDDGEGDEGEGDEDEDLYEEQESQVHRDVDHGSEVIHPERQARIDRIRHIFLERRPQFRQISEIRNESSDEQDQKIEESQRKG